MAQENATKERHSSPKDTSNQNKFHPQQRRHKKSRIPQKEKYSNTKETAEALSRKPLKHLIF